MKTKMTFIGLAALALGILILAAIGCAPNRPFRTYANMQEPANVGTNAATNDIEYYPNFRLGFVEFDDQGWFWNRDQLKAVTNMIWQTAAIGQSNNTAGIVMILFVHGWKNNAAFDNTNVETFRQELSVISKMEQGQTNRAARQVVGVYGGWRGESLNIPYLDNITFWNRKNAAYRVGGYGALTELLENLESLQETSNESLPTNAPKTELIIIGHSFGGQAVYSAISQIVAERYVKTIEQGQPLKPLGDQVILLNPAFEASRYFDLYQMAHVSTNYPTNQLPVLSIFTSKGDWATHYAFPAGRFFSTLFESTRDHEQTLSTREAVGWFQPFVTHDLNYEPLTNSFSEIFTNHPTRLHGQFRNSEAQKKFYAAFRKIREQRANWLNRLSNSISFNGADLVPRASYITRNPFLVVSVDKKIMADHDDISNTNLINFLEQYIFFCDSGAQ
jgi:Alpha/beta hydrolase of unknown function (DUF900)